VSPVLALLPVWMFMYVNAMTKQPKKVEGPLAVGATVYRANCSACHSGNGSGGVGYPLFNGEVIKSFPNIADQIRFVANGNRPYAGKPYTPADREGGAHVAGVRGQPGTMPAWLQSAGGQLTDAEVLAVVCETRFGLAPAELETTYAEEFETWCSAEAANWLAVEEGGFAGLGLDVSAAVPLPSPAEGAAESGG
jgi:mono/diheme cytochrome c family protein